MNITGITPVRIYPTTFDSPEPIYHLSRDLWDANTICGLPYDNSDAVQLRHAVRFARLCRRCQTIAGILITEPAEAIRHISTVTTKGRT